MQVTDIGDEDLDRLIANAEKQLGLFPTKHYHYLVLVLRHYKELRAGVDYEAEYKKLCGFYERSRMLELMAKHWPDVVVVPREPTVTMTAEGWPAGEFTGNYARVLECYRAMLEAAKT